MADLFGLETERFATPKQKSDVSPIDFDPIKFDQELKKVQEDWETKVYNERENLFNEFEKQKGDTYVGFVDPHFPEAQIVNIDLSESDRKQAQDWKDFYLRKQRERFKKLSDEFKTLELVRGGIYNQNYGLTSFADGMVEGASLGLVRPKDPIYGERYKQIFRNSYGYGQLIGNLINFMALSSVASSLKIPELLSKSKTLQPALKILGAPKYYAGKIGRLKFGFDAMTNMARKGALKVPVKYLSDQALRYGSIEAAGALGLTNGLVGAFSEGVRNTAKRFQHEDTMSTKEWRKSLPRALGEGFFQKYFIGLINDPRSWAARFLGDAVYSSGQQVYRLVSGQQDKWNSADFWRSYLEGHLLGEIQGVIFRPNRQQIAAMHANNRILDYAQRLQKKWGGKIDDYWYDANVLWQSELQNAYDKKRFYNPSEKAQAVGLYNQQIQNGYTLYRGLKTAAAYDINPDIIKKITDSVKIPYTLFFHLFFLPHCSDFKNFPIRISSPISAINISVQSLLSIFFR